MLFTSFPAPCLKQLSERIEESGPLREDPQGPRAAFHRYYNQSLSPLPSLLNQACSSILKSGHNTHWLSANPFPSSQLKYYHCCYFLAKTEYLPGTDSFSAAKVDTGLHFFPFYADVLQIPTYLTMPLLALPRLYQVSHPKWVSTPTAEAQDVPLPPCSYWKDDMGKLCPPTPALALCTNLPTPVQDSPQGPSNFLKTFCCASQACLLSSHSLR